MTNEVKARAAPREATMIKKSIQMVGIFPDEVAELRSRELLDDSGIAEEAPEERQRPKCRHFPFSILSLEGRTLADSSVFK